MSHLKPQGAEPGKPTPNPKDWRCEDCQRPLTYAQAERQGNGRPCPRCNSTLVEPDDPFGMCAAEWNDRYPIGTPVRYRSVRGRAVYVETKTRSAAWALGSGDAVVAIDGRAGGVPLWSVQPIPVSR